MTRNELLARYESINKFTYEHLLPLMVGVALVNGWVAIFLQALESKH
jgi:hypothetical protein